MDIQKIKELALANGFKLKEQASGNMDLNAYVYDFASAIEQATKAQAVPEGFVLVKDEPVAYMVQNESWKRAHGDDFFEVKLLNEMPEPEFDGDSYDVEIPLYMIEAQEPAND